MSSSQCLLKYSTEDTKHNYINDYDQATIKAIDQADYQDYQQQEDKEDEYIMNEGLLKLIVDVQSYLSEISAADSHLLPLQYKIYNYLKQRALDVRMDDTFSFIQTFAA
ncbi:hypothetical protein G6F37_005638 [Rhizopus arrhizus]|nr:hypothetical protein G6F38_005748 [Rhizopus arrhizus]KAG1158606.1 hypothetical protein G6F37_005638 [Rhizopus arrhizus]